SWRIGSIPPFAEGCKGFYLSGDIMQLFAKVYLDEDVSVLLAELLKARGFDASTALASGMLGKLDEEQLAYAVVQQRALLTHNRKHFEQLHERYIAESKSHFGIILAVRRDVYELAQRAARLLNTVTADEMEKQLRYI